MTMPKLIWRVPIRNLSVSEADQVAHLIPDTPAKNILFRTFCGQDVNPGFAASPGKSTKRCTRCAKWQDSIQFPHYGKQNAPTT